MADQDSPLSQPESNNFENDFEKLDPFAPTGANPDEIVSSSAPTGEEAEEDLYSASPVGGSEPLISLGGESTGSSGVETVVPQQAPLPPEPVQPDSSTSLPEALAAAANEPLPVSPPPPSAPAARPEPEPVLPPSPVQPPVPQPSAPPAQTQAPVQATPAPAQAAAGEPPTVKSACLLASYFVHLT